MLDAEVATFEVLAGDVPAREAVRALGAGR